MPNEDEGRDWSDTFTSQMPANPRKLGERPQADSPSASEETSPANALTLDGTSCLQIWRTVTFCCLIHQVCALYFATAVLEN